MFRFQCLGSGSSGNCYFFQTEQTTFLVDAGLGSKTLKRHFLTMGQSMNSIDAVFVTHDHADHIKSVGRLAQEFDVDIYATELVHEGIGRNYCVVPRVEATHRKTLNKQEPFTLKDVVITPFHVPHDSTDCVGFRIESHGIRFCLVTDIGHITPEVEEEVKNANFLVLEGNHDKEMLMAGPYPAYLKGRISGPQGHLSNKEAAELLVAQASPTLKHVWLCHLSEENNHPELARKTVDTILRSNGIVAGVDFQFDVLKRKVPSEMYDLEEAMRD